ncbi:MarR family winged helix-turn-helix transcriptional regulator [Aquimarina pacifica]|uniref:MarR family winged helix-turn-helix transcriptional regulator n=1 Tax=Aquimarina pacifica TaxID=1296415 RepID=UPI000470820B|nr:MarR family transcriptional regulator [Aquimarina pacifica]
MNITLPQNTVFYQLEKAIKTYRKLAQDRINASGHDVSVNQLILLINLSEHPNATQAELSEYIFKDFASVARMVDILVKKNYLERRENTVDRRKKDLRPTVIGERMIKELRPIIKEYRQTALFGFTNENLDEISRLLRDFITNCEKGLATTKK